jgi:hypothetical protein
MPLVSRLPLPLLQGSLDLLVLGVLASGPTHGYGVAALVRERSGGALEIEDAALSQALHRLERPPNTAPQRRNCGAAQLPLRFDT